MPEILTESFCERCGTRYTFESARQRVRLKRVKVLSRGVKNFVLSDATSMDEAMASARAETDRKLTTYQLDAFHQTFTFCMSCRQYTCSNCWNTAEAKCLSCAPLAVTQVYASTPALADLDVAQPIPAYAANGSNGHAPETEPVLAEAGAAETLAEPVASVVERAEVEAYGPIAGDSIDEEPAAVEAAKPEAVEAAEPVATPDAVPAQPDRLVPVDRAAAAAGAAASIDVGLKTAAQTKDLLRRFRPGQNLDAELEAYERDRAATLAAASVKAAAEAATPEASTSEPAKQAEHIERAAEVAAAAPAPEPAQVTEAGPTPEPPQPEAAPSAEAAPPEAPPTRAAPAPAAASAAAPTPAQQPATTPPPRIEDVVVQPTWQRVAPDVTPEQPPVAPSMPAAASSGDGQSPKWPERPEWPSTRATTGLPFLGRPTVADNAADGVWAASIREVVATPRVPGKAANVVQPCVNCGLSLSANARFCRRCGTPQG